MIIGGAAITGIITIITAVSITITIRITGTTTCITEVGWDGTTTRLTILTNHTRVVVVAVEFTEELMKVCVQEVRPIISSEAAVCVAGHKHLNQVVE